MTQSTARNLVVCCDGTGNVWRASGSQTNVVRLVQALHPDPARQIVYYDPGVGTAVGLRPVIEKILTHLGLDPQPPPRGRAREIGQH